MIIKAIYNYTGLLITIGAWSLPPATDHEGKPIVPYLATEIVEQTVPGSDVSPPIFSDRLGLMVNLPNPREDVFLVVPPWVRHWYPRRKDLLSVSSDGSCLVSS